MGVLGCQGKDGFSSLNDIRYKAKYFHHMVLREVSLLSQNRNSLLGGESPNFLDIYIDFPEKLNLYKIFLSFKIRSVNLPIKKFES
jgi:hypothetical protein